MNGKIIAKSPLALDLEAGKKYAICTCGESTNQPYCDGKHAGSEFRPHVFTADEDKTAYICQCKHTSNPGFCDGSHKSL